MRVAELISRNIRAFRERAGLSQKQLAQKAGISLRYISQVETGAPNITVDVVEKLAGVLKVTPADILQDGKLRASTQTLSALDQCIRLLKSLRSHLK